MYLHFDSGAFVYIATHSVNVDVTPCGDEAIRELHLRSYHAANPVDCGGTVEG